MQATIEQLSKIIVFASVETTKLGSLIPHAQVRAYIQGGIILHQGDRLPPKLYSLLSGSIEIAKTATTGKETILRNLLAEEIFAAPA